MFSKLPAPTGLWKEDLFTSPGAVGRLAAGTVRRTAGIVGRGSSQRLARWVLNNAPMVVFCVVYFFTCLLGALLFLADYGPFVRLFEYFSGTHVPHLSESQGATVLTLLCVAPLCLWLGFSLGRRVPLRGRRGDAARRVLCAADLDPPRWVPVVVFGVCGVIAFVSIARAGALSAIPSWIDYGHFISAREQIFSRVSFMEFVNIYAFLPFSAAWVMLTLRRGGLDGLLVRWLPLAWTEVIDLLLFQKKTAIVSLLIVVFAWLFFRARTDVRRRALLVGAGATVVLGLGIFFVTVVAPVYSKASKATVCVSGAGRCGGSGHVPALVVYSVLSPLTRTSAPVLYYPLVFPRKHGFYGIDLFQDELGLPSAFATDNRVIWKYQNPNGPAGGTSAAPFQFSLYSGAGLAVTLVECLVIGTIMGLLWRLSMTGILPLVWSSLLASAECLFGVYLAIDSWRNDTTVSYGALWALFFIVFAALSVHLLSGRAHRVRSWRGATAVAALAVVVLGLLHRDWGQASSYVPAVNHAPAAHAADTNRSSAAIRPTIEPLRTWSRPSATTRLATRGNEISLRTSPLRYGYQLQSPYVALAAGRYQASVSGRVVAGGLNLGVLDTHTQKWIVSSSFGSQRRPTRMNLSFTLARRTTVQVVLSNDAPRPGGRSRWLLRWVTVSSTGSAGVTWMWRAGLK